MTIVSLSVRYASATVEEFIEHHALEVSARGIYIKTERSIPLGTLIEFEVRIGGNQTVLGGAGRVVWTREASASAPDKPPGIGVRFIELDEASQALVGRVLAERPDAGRKYEEESEVVLSRVPTPPPSGAVSESAPGPPGPHAPTPPNRRSSRPKPPVKSARRTLPPVAAPPRRSVAPPRPSPPPDDADASDADNTQVGSLPTMPKGRKSTLVGLGAPNLPRVTPPPRRRTSRPPPAPRPTPAPPPSRPSGPLPPPTPPPPRATDSLRPVPRPSKVDPVELEDDADEPTLFEARASLPPPAESLDLPIEVDEAEPEPTVIVPRESPVPEPPSHDHGHPEITAPQSMQELHGLPPDVPRELGDTQRIRRGKKRRLVVLGAVLLCGAGVVYAALGRSSGPAPAPIASASAPTAPPPAPEPPPSATETPPVEAAAEAAPPEDATPAATPTPTPTSTPMEFPALPIERAPAPSAARRTAPAEPSSPASSQPSPKPAPTPVAPHEPAATAAPSPAPNCNPTYTLDAEGNKHFKPECFGK